MTDPKIDTNNSGNHQPICLISGGSSGIGLAIALKFAGQGYRIAICGRRRQLLDDAVQQIIQVTDSPGDVMARVVDFADPDQAQQFALDVLENWGNVNVLVNNAAAAPLAPFEEISAADFEATVSINIRSVFYLTQTIWMAMKHTAALTQNQSVGEPVSAESRTINGTVVNISSLAAVDPYPGFSIYGASKAWLDLLTQALAAEGQSAGLRVCSIRPGAVETPLLRSLFPDYPASDCETPQTVAELVWACVSQPDRFPSGQAFEINR